MIPLVKLSAPINLAAPRVEYQSCGRLLLLGPEDVCGHVASKLQQRPTILVTHGVISQDHEYLAEAIETLKSFTVYHYPLTQLSGHLGAFFAVVKIQDESINLAHFIDGSVEACFDLVLDLNPEPVLSGVELLPPGYFHLPADDQGRHTEADIKNIAETLANLEGGFSKPLYYRVNEDLCGHQKGGKLGCTRCLDSCAADAIYSTGRSIESNPFLCQGQGACSTACPTGAISFAYPTGDALRTQWANTLRVMASDTAPVIVIHQALADEEKQSIVEELSVQEASRPVVFQEVEEVASVGMESWLAILAAGYQQLLLRPAADSPATTQQVLNYQVELCQTLLAACGQPSQRLAVYDQRQALDTVPYTYHDNLESQDGKRALINAALATLELAPSERVPLVATAPFGEVVCDSQGCTLCHSCVTVCPANALSANPQAPQLIFTEQNCIQCGLCVAACPENVLSISASFQPRTALRADPILLHEEKPLLCISCGKPFALESVVSRMEESLSQNAFFQGDAIKRLRMCGDCRVRDIYPSLIADPLAQLKL